MEKWIYAVYTVCADPSKEAEFHDWYNNTHMPDLLKTPGMVRATRYEIAEPVEGEGKYLALYEIESDDIGKTMEGMGKNVAGLIEQGRMSELSRVVKRLLYKKIAEKVSD